MIYYRAILFDFDGVLAATMEDNFRAWQKALADYGVRIRPDEYFMLEGMELREVARRLLGWDKPGNDVLEEIVKKKEEYYLHNHTFAFYPGVEDFLANLSDKNIPFALVSAARLPRLLQTASKNFLEKFGAVVTSEDGGRGKPFPDPYLRAARKLQVPIQNCIVVENAPLGIESAKRAGAYCIAISSTLSKDELAGADEISESFLDLSSSSVVRSLRGRN